MPLSLSCAASTAASVEGLRTVSWHESPEEEQEEANDPVDHLMDGRRQMRIRLTNHTHRISLLLRIRLARSLRVVEEEEDISSTVVWIGLSLVWTRAVDDHRISR